MKTSILSLRHLLTPIALLAILTSLPDRTHGQTDGTFIDDSGGWGVTNRWSNATIASGVGATATFLGTTSNSVGGPVSIINQGGFATNITIGNINFASTNTGNLSWVFSFGTLNFAASGPNSPTITSAINPGGTTRATFNTNVVIAGNQGLTLDGGGRYFFRSTNVSLTGGITLRGSGTQIGFNELINESWYSTAMLANNALTIAGTNNQVFFGYGNLNWSNNFIFTNQASAAFFQGPGTVSGTTGVTHRLSGSMSGELQSTASGSLIFLGAFTNSAGEGSRYILSGDNSALSFSSATNRILIGNSGAADTRAAVLRLESSTALGDDAGRGRIEFWASNTNVNTSSLELAGGITVHPESVRLKGEGNQGLGSLRSVNGDNTFLGDVIKGSYAALSGVIGVDADSLTLGGRISVGSSTNALIKVGEGRLVLTATNNIYNNTSGVQGGLRIDQGAVIVGAAIGANVATNVLPGWNANGGFTVQSGAALGVRNMVTDSNVSTMLYSTTNFQAGSSIAYDTFGSNRTVVTAISNTAQGSLGLRKFGAGTLTLSGNNTYSGTTAVSAGALIVDGSVAGATTVGAGAVLGGSGTMGGAVTVSGILAPGNSPGTMTFDQNLTLDLNSTSIFEINAFTPGQFDLAQGGAGNQTVTFDGTLQLVFANNFSSVGSVKIFDFENYSGAFDAVNPTGLASGYTASFNELTGVVTVVPEPSTYALLALAGAGLAGHVLRRRRRD